MGDWLKVYRIAYRNDVIRAKVAEGGEPYGNPVMKYTAKPGQWLCENPQNGHRWICSDEGFRELYCEVGKVPKKKKKKRQEDGHRKGQSRHRSASHESGKKYALNEGALFEEET